MISITSRRYISSTATRCLKDSSKAAATLINLDNQAASTPYTGNSFKSFAEYRKSAIQHGPLKKKFSTTYHSKEFKPIYSEDKDYGVSETFAKQARSINYRV